MRPPGRAKRETSRLPAIGLAAGLLLLLSLSCRSGGGKPMAEVSRGWRQIGVASWYGADFHGRRTANGEIYDMYGMTAAHKTLPFDTLVEVENLDNGRSVRVRINDRGPFVRGRIIDLTYTAAETIGMIGPGTARVRIRVVGVAEVPGRKWVVQVGAFSDPTLARARQRELSGFSDVRIESAAGIHRVLVGRFDQEKRAQKVARRLRREGFEVLVRPEVD